MSAGVVWTASNGAHRTGTSRSYTSNIVPEPFKVRVWWTNSLHYSWTFASVLVDSSPLSYFFTFAKVWIPGLHRTIVWHRSYSICPRSTFEIARAQLRAEIPVGVSGWSPIRYGSRTGAKDIRYYVNIAGSYSPRHAHAQSLANGRAGNEEQKVVQSFPRDFTPSSHLPQCCPFHISLSTLTFHVGQDVELGRVVVGSFADGILYWS